MPRSPKLKLRIFFTVTFAYGNYNTYIGSSNAITQILRTFSKFPLLLSSKRVRPEASDGSEFGLGAVDGKSRPQSSRIRTGQVAKEIQKEKSEIRWKRLENKLKMSKAGGKGGPAKKKGETGNWNQLMIMTMIFSRIW